MFITVSGADIILDCHKNARNGEYFRLVIDKNSLRVKERPDNADIYASAAYSRIYHILKSNEDMPGETVAAWG